MSLTNSEALAMCVHDILSFPKSPKCYLELSFPGSKWGAKRRKHVVMWKELKIFSFWQPNVLFELRYQVTFPASLNKRNIFSNKQSAIKVIAHQFISLGNPIWPNYMTNYQMIWAIFCVYFLFLLHPNSPFPCWKCWQGNRVGLCALCKKHKHFLFHRKLSNQH